MKTHISKAEMEGHWNASYKVRTVVPSTDDPYVKEFDVFQEELSEYLRNYSEHDEFIISMEVSNNKLEMIKDSRSKKIKLSRTDFKDSGPLGDLMK
jgi:hypothetical protein